MHSLAQGLTPAAQLPERREERHGPVGRWYIEEFTTVAQVTSEQLAAYVDDG